MSGPSDSKIQTGLNYHGLFFEELVGKLLLEKGEHGRFVALKEERPYSYNSIYGKGLVSGTADFVGFYHAGSAFGSSPTVFAIECKKVNAAKTWVFTSMKDDPFQTESDNPNYILRLLINDKGDISKRSAEYSLPFDQSLAIKSYEIMDTGKVLAGGNSEEKIYNACKQAVAATNGIFMNDEECGLSLFGRKNRHGAINYVPLVLTNANLKTLVIDAQDIDTISGELDSKNKLDTTEVGWVYYAYNLSPDERLNLSMKSSSGERFPGTPLRRIVPIVNINFIDDFLLSFRGYAL